MHITRQLMKQVNLAFGFKDNSLPMALNAWWLILQTFPNPRKITLQKTDPRDTRNLGLRLQSGVLRGIHIPDEQQEADRIFFRHRKRIWKDLNPVQEQDQRRTCL